MKQYKLLVETAEYPKGTIIEHVPKGDETSNTYNVKLPDGTIFMSQFFTGQIENRPDIWERVHDDGDCWCGCRHIQFPHMEKQESKPHPYRPFYPGDGILCWYVGDTGYVIRMKMSFSTAYMYNRVYKGVFPTEEGAKMENLRREARAKCWFPNKGDVCYAYDMEMEEVVEYPYSGDDIDAKYVSMGNVHRTAEGALEWKEKYLEAFTCLL